MSCEHKKIKKIYSHGRKSKPMIVCKRCGAIVSRNELAKKRVQKEKLKRRLQNKK